MNKQEYLKFDKEGFTTYMKSFLHEMEFFINSDHVILAIAKSFSGYNNPKEKYLSNCMFLNFTGRDVFFQLSGGLTSKSGGGPTLTGSGTVVNPHGLNPVIFQISATAGNYFLEDQGIGFRSEFTPVAESELGIPKHKMVFKPLPEVRIQEYLFKMPNGNYIYVDNIEYNYSYEHMRVFINKAGLLNNNIKVEGFQRYRDGGTTIIATEEGILVSPTPFNKDAKATWTEIDSQPVELEKVPDGEVKITYTEGTILLIEKQMAKG